VFFFSSPEEEFERTKKALAFGLFLSSSLKCFVTLFSSFLRGRETSKKYTQKQKKTKKKNK